MKYTLDGIDCPWHGRAGDGREESVDGTPAFCLAETDVAEVLWSFTTGDDWDGNCAALVLLTNDRGFAAWESSWGPTGSGFSEDAYGGGACVYFAMDEVSAAEKLSDRHVAAIVTARAPGA
jgi:hypothetical protein